MKKLLTILAFLGLLTGISINVASADEPVYYPTTLDLINNKSQTIVGTSATYALTKGTAPAGTVSIKIGNDNYYYTPELTEGLTLQDYQNLSNTGSYALNAPEATAGEGLNLQFGENYYTYTASKLPTSGYTLTETSTPTSTSLTIPVYDEVTQTVVNKSYNFALKKTEYVDGNAPYSVQREYTVNIPVNNTTKIYVNYETSTDTHVTVTSPNTIVNENFVDCTTDTALSNSATGTQINSNFLSCAIDTENEDIHGAALNNNGTISYIVGDFIDNFYNGITIMSSYAGAIYNSGTISYLIGDFINNHSSGSFSVYGGAIANDSGEFGNITANFYNNYSNTPDCSTAAGGAIYNEGTIGNITGDFISNYTHSSGSTAAGGAIYNGYNAQIGNITGDFISNHADSDGYWGSYFIAQGGAIYNRYNAQIGNITGDFINCFANATSDDPFDFVAQGGAIYNENTIGNISGSFIGNYAQADEDGTAQGGAIYNKGTIGDISGSFIGNYAKTIESGTAQGGAIYTTKDLTFVANNKTNVFKDNYTQVGTTKDDNAIYVADSNATLTFNATNNGRFEFYDNIKGVDGYKVKLTSTDGKGTFSMYNDMVNANLILDNINLSTVNNTIHHYNFNTITLSNHSSNMFVDADLATGEMDTISATTACTAGSNFINVKGINLMSDLADADETSIQFVVDANPTDPSQSAIYESLKQAVNYTGDKQITGTLYKYNVAYDKTTGNFVFAKPSVNSYDNLNSALFATAVGAQVGGYITQLNSYDQAFRNMDMYMLMPKEQRQAMKFANKYASTASKTDVVYDPTYSQYYNNAAWFRPYVTFENVPLNNGPKVNNTSYGAFFGGDSGLKDLGHGWDGLWGVYVGYNGSIQDYDGNKIYQNGGTLGLNGTLYKGNFFLGGTVNVGASAAEQNTMFGKDTFAMLMSGVAAKAGYNWELFDGRFIIQPSYMMSYSFVNAFDYTNSQGIRMSSDPLHAIQIAPEIKFIANLKNGWQPYLSVQMIWNLIDETHFNASYAGENVNLPSLSVDPFVKYGVGVQKNWGERFTGFFQTYVTNGGRNGVGLQAGFRWAIGK